MLPPTRNPKDKAPRVKVDPQDATLADRIHEFGRSRGWSRPGTRATLRDRESLAVHRRWLARKGVDLPAVWAWYESRADVGYPKLPRVSCGFVLTRTKIWAWVFEAFERQTRNDALYAPPADPHPDTRFVLADATNRPWPEGVEEHLPGVVDRSVKNFNGFLDRMAAVPDSAYRENRWVWVAVRDALGDGVEYLTQWFRWVHRAVKDWEGWSGQLSAFVWTPDHKRFVASANRIVAEYCGRPGNEWAEIVAVAEKFGRGRTKL